MGYLAKGMSMGVRERMKAELKKSEKKITNYMPNKVK